MNNAVEKIIALLNGFRLCGEITHSAYSALYDEIALFATPQKMWLCNGELCCPQCGSLCKSYYHYCTECGQAVTWND